MRRFTLSRTVDYLITVLAVGVECEPDGMVLLYWFGTKSAGVYPSMEVVKATHCAGSLYSQEVGWIDE